ncbi:uncharacterized protein LOC135848306 [Planococcus citri]|uniref:uncharacterized protein LOC135848306 n=1 Tax=Planococcus citri TaxID=170843 RepID=UPI0031F80B77
MAEIFPDVYDFVHPTPVSLKELAAMAVSLEIWRCEMNKYRKSDTLEEFWPSCECISLKTILPDLPSTIANVIAKYVRRFALSIQDWLNVHHTKVFRFHSNYKTYVLNKFDDFVCDYNGTVHREKTAKRMMDSDRLSQDEKFKIACVYFFEDDIRRIWPSTICRNMNLCDIDFDENAELYYWIGCLENKLPKIPGYPGNYIEERTLKKCITNNSRQSVEYFWDRINLVTRMRTAIDCFHTSTQSSVRFILPKLDEEKLAEFVNLYGVELIQSLLLGFGHDETLVLSTWMYIRNVMNVSQITDLVVRMMLTEASGWLNFNNIENFLCLCFEILNDLPLDSKLTIIRTILSNHNNVLVESRYADSGSWRTIEFLLRFLPCVPVEERNVFWHSYWHLIIPRTRCKDLKRIMDICFENEDEIVEFKENIMTGNESVRGVCVSLWNQCFFDELNGFVNFCYPDTGKARRFKQELLQSSLFGESVSFSIECLNSSKEFNEFIDDAYENSDLSTDFKIQLMSSPEIQYRLSQYACEKVYEQLMEFIDMFVPSEQSTLMQQIKTRMINALKEKLIGHMDSSILYSWLSKSSFKSFLLWCLRSEDEVDKFQLECVSEFKQRIKMLRG